MRTAQGSTYEQQRPKTKNKHKYLIDQSKNIQQLSSICHPLITKHQARVELVRYLVGTSVGDTVGWVGPCVGETVGMVGASVGTLRP